MASKCEKGILQFLVLFIADETGENIWSLNKNLENIEKRNALYVQVMKELHIDIVILTCMHWNFIWIHCKGIQVSLN